MKAFLLALVSVLAVSVGWVPLADAAALITPVQYSGTLSATGTSSYISSTGWVAFSQSTNLSAPNRISENFTMPVPGHPGPSGVAYCTAQQDFLISSNNIEANGAVNARAWPQAPLHLSPLSILCFRLVSPPLIICRGICTLLGGDKFGITAISAFPYRGERR
jgi:hypothetical protein